MKTLRLCGFAALAAALVAAPVSANHSWNGYHWASTSKPVALTVNTSISSIWNTSVATAISDWNVDPSASPLNLPYAKVLDLTSAKSGADPKKCSAIVGQILVCNAAYGPRGWLGIASISIDSSNHITKGTTKLNDSYFNTATYNKPEWRALVACQEIGHDFGLAHQDENFSNTNLGSCMDYTNNPLGGGSNGSLQNLHPNEHDYEELAIIYGHTDSYATAKAVVATNFGIRQFGKPAPAAVDSGEVGDSPAEWGSAIHQDGKGRPDLFVLDLPDGGRRITHVFWALETKRSDIH